MRPASSLEEYLASPVGRYFAGRTFAHFFPSADFAGTLIFGRPDEEDVRAMGRAIESELPERCGDHVSIADTRRLTGADPAAFEALVEFFRSRSARFGEVTHRHALVRPPGVIGAVVAGFWDVAPTPYRHQIAVFTEVADALRWLGADAGIEAQIEALHAAVSGTPRAVQAIRDHLSANLERPALADIARKLAVSPRTLQEQLQAAGTTFRDELNAARVRAAEALMLGTDHKLTAIALEVGCASLQHFSTVFRKATGESPSAWRARRAPAAAR